MNSNITKIVINVNGTDVEFSSLSQIEELRDVLNSMLPPKAYWNYPDPTLTGGAIKYSGGIITAYLATNDSASCVCGDPNCETPTPK